jgi:hypothetical protein
MMTALCFMKHGPRRVPVTMVDGRFSAACPECPRTFDVLEEQVKHDPDDLAAFVFRLWPNEPEERIIVVLAGSEADARALYGDEREHDDAHLELITSAPAIAGTIVDSAVYP